MSIGCGVMVYKLSGTLLLGGFLCTALGQPVQAETTLLRLDRLQAESTTASELQLAQAPAQITRVRVESASQGLRLLLDATDSLETPTTSVVGNALVAEIPNAVLALPAGDTFEQFNPADGIALVTVTNLDGNRVRVAITGSDGPPNVTVNAAATGLVLGIVPGLGLATGDDDTLRIGVTGTGESYAPRNSSTATRTDTPLRNIPQSIQVIPQAVIEDRNATELGNALETAASVVSRGGRGTSIFGPGFLIRGFPVEEGIFRDGIEAFSLAPFDTNDIERVEVLRGPASVLFGQGDPGGIINLVSKQPLSDPFYGIDATAGSFSTYRGDVDLSGPLNASRSVRYRLNVSYENFGSFRDFVDGERVIASPTVTWDIGPSTSLDLYGQYAYNRETIDEGIPFTADGPVAVPRSRFVGEDFGEFSQDQFSVGYRLNHDFSDDWTLRHSTQYLQYSLQRYAPLYSFFDEATGLVERTEYFAGGRYQRFFTNIEAVGRFNTGPVQHQVLAGVEYRNVLEQPEFQFSNAYPAIDVFNPVYIGIPYPINPEFFRDDTVNTGHWSASR